MRPDRHPPSSSRSCRSSSCSGSGSAQLTVAGWAQLSAGEAARAGARAVHVGAAPAVAARHALPDALEPATVRVDGAEVTVRVRAPALLPGLPSLPLTALSALEPEAGS